MPLICCPHCGDDTFTLTGWAAVDHCASCGERLTPLPVELPPVDAAAHARRRIAQAAERDPGPPAPAGTGSSRG